MNRKVEQVNVIAWQDEKEIIISSTSLTAEGDRFILRGEGFPLVKHRSLVDVVQFFEDGFVEGEGEISLSTESQLNVRILKEDEKQNRRKYIRVKVQDRIRLIRAYSLVSGRRSYVIDEEAQAEDMNIGGVCFRSNRVFLKKQKIDIGFEFLKGFRVVTAEVLRIRKAEPGSGHRYRYGCRFLELDQEQERSVCEYVFKVQIESSRKKKE